MRKLAIADAYSSLMCLGKVSLNEVKPILVSYFVDLFSVRKFNFKVASLLVYLLVDLLSWA